MALPPDRRRFLNLGEFDELAAAVAILVMDLPVSSSISGQQAVCHGASIHDRVQISHGPRGRQLRPSDGALPVSVQRQKMMAFRYTQRAFAPAPPNSPAHYATAKWAPNLAISSSLIANSAVYRHPTTKSAVYRESDCLTLAKAVRKGLYTSFRRPF